MRTTELRKLTEYLELGGTISNVDENELLNEINNLLNSTVILGESLAAPSSSLRCPNCGHKIY